jgi:penicillin amidase
MFKRVGIGFAYVLGLLIVGLIVLGIVFIRRTVPKNSGSLTVHGIKNPVQIERDSFGVPNIYGETDEDTFFGFGYAQAEDRMFQMDMVLRIGQGRLSEILGHRGVQIDTWSRTIGFGRIGKEMLKVTSPKTRALLTAYTSGVNAYIDAHSGNPGFEFDALKSQPLHWRPEDCLVVGRLMSWEQNFSYWTDAAFSDIALSVDSAHLASLFPDYPEDGPTAVEGKNFASVRLDIPSVIQASAPMKVGIAKPRKSTTPAPPTPTPAKPKPITPKLHEPLQVPHAPIRTGENFEPSERDELAQFYSELHGLNLLLTQVLGYHNMGGGSNTFVVGPSHSKSGGAMLENDAHLALAAPARWHLVHLVSKEGLNVAGFSVPGLPVIISGRNEHIAWGITSGMADESDFFVETSTADGKQYVTARGNQAYQIIHDSLKVRDSVTVNSDPEHPTFTYLKFDTRLTMHGPVLSDHPFRMAPLIYHNPRAGGVPKDTTIFGIKHPVTLQWNGAYALEDEVGCFLNLHKTHSITEARQAMSKFATPILNMCFAEAGSGSIAYEYVGRLPKRNGNEHTILLARDGTNANEEWQGFINASELPESVNPARGYFVSANNPPVHGRSVPYSNGWEPAARSERIAELIESGGRLDTAAIKRISLDVTSPYDRDNVVPALLSVYPDPEPYSIKPDSSSLYRFDSMRHAWKWDSLRRNTKLSDSAVVAIIYADSLSTRFALSGIHREASQNNPLTETALEYLRNWDGGMRAKETAPAIYAVFLQRLLENTFIDELGRERYGEFTFISNVPLRTLGRLVNQPDNIWWDDTRTPTIHETRDDIFKRSLAEALTYLKETLGPDPRTWQWGRLHPLTYHHQFEAAGSAVAQMVNLETGPANGGLTSVYQAAYNLWAPYEMHVGPSMRLIADMKTTTLSAALPTGNSERIFSPHYKDMIDLFAAGNFDEIALLERNPRWPRFELLPGK